MSDVGELRDVADEAARIGGRILQGWRAKFTAREKSPKNLVTEADVGFSESTNGSQRPRRRAGSFAVTTAPRTD